MTAGSRLPNGRPSDGVSPAVRAVIRTCIGCRSRASATDLLRVVVRPVNRSDQMDDVSSGSDVLPDPRRRAIGRGAWLHPVLECMDLAERRRAFGRALRLSGQPNLDAVRQYVESLAG